MFETCYLQANSSLTAVSYGPFPLTDNQNPTEINVIQERLNTDVTVTKIEIVENKINFYHKTLAEF